ncbi:MAG TPA: hypothetical protein VII06_22815 [Chloroflexota bacterium]|jgi:hypothetical protein
MTDDEMKKAIALVRATLSALTERRYPEFLASLSNDVIVETRDQDGRLRRVIYGRDEYMLDVARWSQAETADCDSYEVTRAQRGADGLISIHVLPRRLISSDEHLRLREAGQPARFDVGPALIQRIVFTRGISYR